MQELLREVLREITAEPLRFVAEVLQSALLLGILIVAGRRFVGKRLVERQARIARELAEAETAERDGARLREEAGAAAARVAAEGAEAARALREQTNTERSASLAQLETEAREIVAQARQRVESEKERVRREASGRLLQLTTEAARRYLDEMLTETERRTVSQQAILASLQEMERGVPPGDAGAR
jgi:F0F1-type ATP synthase membrane subunit b/b'